MHVFCRWKNLINIHTQMCTRSNIVRFTLRLLLVLMVISASAKVNSVLKVVPTDTAMVIRVEDLKGFNREVSNLIAEMDPTTDPKQEILGEILADTFDAGFESLAELEEIGLNLSQDFAIFIDQNSQGSEPLISAAIHIADQDMFQQMLDQEQGGTEEITHNGVTYRKATGEDETACFVFLDDVMVYSANQQICEKVINTYQKQNRSFLKSTDFADLKLDLTSGVNDVVAYIAVQQLVQDNQQLLSEAMDQWGHESGQEAAFELFWSWMQQIKSISLTLQYQDGEVLLTPFIQMAEDSEIAKFLQPIRGKARNFPLLQYVPQNSSLVVGGNINSDQIAELTQYWMNMAMQMVKQSGATKLPENAESLGKEVVTLMAAFYATVDPQFANSFDITSSMFPDSSQIFQVKDQKKLIKLLDDGYIESMYGSGSIIYKAMGLAPEGKVVAGPTEVYEGVEIKSHLLPNVTTLPDNPGGQQLEMVLPDELHVYHAIAEDLLIISTAETPRAIKSIVDTTLGLDNGFDQNAGYTRMMEVLDADGYGAVAISPMTIVNQVLNLVAQSDPNVGMVGVMLANIPQTYSLMIGAAPKNDGLELRVFISLMELKQLYSMTAAFLGQMEGGL